ncbi:MAG: hypothetical protein ABS916_03575 [Carnobacterium sp.]|uniref:hypothetical protein n=1 Tax=Carnobacterium sp. TaxID=48221 RepID=UPI003316136E
MSKSQKKVLNYKEYPQRIALRIVPFAISFWTSVYGWLLLKNTQVIKYRESYGFIKLIGQYLGEAIFPSLLIIVGILKMLSIVFDWKIKKLFLHTLSISWGMLLINFIVQNNNGGSNYGWLFCFIVLSVLIAAYGEEQELDG